MKIIQVAADRQAGVWFYDKENQKLIGISTDAMRNINDMENVSIIGITVGVSSLLTGVLSYISALYTDINYIAVFVFAVFSIFCAYIYAIRNMKRVSAEAKKIGRKYDLESGILRYISRAGKLDYIILVAAFIIVFSMGSAFFYEFLFVNRSEIKMLIISILSFDVVAMILVTLHPVQKLLFWIKVRKKYKF